MTVSTSTVFSFSSKLSTLVGVLLFGAAITVTFAPLQAQQPFYTDDPGVTDTWAGHIEVSDEFDFLQASVYPDLKQNTTNYRFNIGLPFHLEFDLDNPTLMIFRTVNAPLPQRSFGQGDLNTGLKWNFRPVEEGSRKIAMSATFYVEIPTGDSANELGSGLHDYWLNTIAQKRITDKVTVTTNAGILFAGNTSTGVIGIRSRGLVGTGGLSVIRTFSERLRMGVEVYGGLTTKIELSKGQLQILAGGKYQWKPALSIDFGLLGGWYVASPRVGAQLGISLDFPILRKPQADDAVTQQQASFVVGRNPRNR